MDVSSEMIYPLVPLFLAKVLGVNKSLIGLIEGIAESTASLLKVFSGWFSDRMGQRKYLMAVGYGVSTLSRPIMAVAGTREQILTSRLIDRIGKGIRTAPRDTLIAESAQHTILPGPSVFTARWIPWARLWARPLPFFSSAFSNVVYSLSAIPAGMAADRFGRKRIILLGFVLFAGLYYGFAIAGSPGAVWLLFAMYGLFMGLTEGIQKAFLATIIPPDFKATVFGVYATATGVAMLPASLVGGWLWDRFSPAATFYFGAVTASLSALMFVALIVAMRNSSDVKGS